MMGLEANSHAPCRSAERPVLTSSALRIAGRDVPPVFAVDLVGEGDDHRLEVVQVLRVLPGRRVVGRALWQGRTVLAKLFVGAEGAANRQAASAETEGLQRMHSAGVPSPEVIHATGLAGDGCAVLLEYLDSAQTMAAAWSDAPEDRLAMFERLETLLSIVGRLHAAGYGHADLHLGNVLLAGGRSYLIDGDAVQAFPADAGARAKAQLANLALCLVQLPLWTVPWWAQGLKVYAAAGAAVPAREALDVAVRLARGRRLRRFLSKTGRDCSEFSIERRLSRVVGCVRVLRETLLPLLGAPDAWVAQGAMLKDGGTCTVVRAMAGNLDCVVKRYNLKNLRHALSRSWRPSRAWHSWRAGHLLRHLGVATPEPLAVLEERFGPLRRRAFLVTRHCPGRSLQEQLDAGRKPDREEAAALLELFSALHSMRIEHGDLKATNLLWLDGQLWVIDLDAMHRHASTTSYLRAWRRDRRRFLANWPEGSVLRCWLETNLPPVG